MGVHGLTTAGWISDLEKPVIVEPLSVAIAELQLMTATIDVETQLSGVLTVPESLTATLEDVTDQTGTIATPEAITGELFCVVVGQDPYTITGFVVGTGVVELGANLVTPSFTATYSQPPETATLTDDAGSPAKDVISTPGAFTSDGTFQKTTNNDTVTFTLNASRAGEPDSENTLTQWQPRTFWGLGGAALLTEAQIEALAGSQLDSDFAAVFTVGPMTNVQYGWYCFPQSYDPGDAAQFRVSQFAGGWIKVGAVSVTNPYGVTQDYACWRTTNPGLDEIEVTVF